MAKKCIGIELSDQTLRMVTAEAVKGVPVLTGASERQIETEAGVAKTLAEMLGEVGYGDRVAVSLPAIGSYYRLLEFPLGEARKIESALPLEMSSQVPATDELVCDFLTPSPREGGFLVPAAAVRRTAVEAVVELFRVAGQPLHLLDLSPFGYAAGLAAVIGDGVLAVVLRRELTVARLSSGKVAAFRSMPVKAQDSPSRLAAVIQNGYLALSQPGSENPAPLFLIGEGAGEELCQALAGIGLSVSHPALALGERMLSPAFLPAAALALRAALPARSRQFNFLKGDLAPKSEWAAFRRQLIAAAVLVGLSAGLAGTGAFLNYSHKQTLAETLREETVAVFRQTFPEARNIVDAPAQMRSKLTELQEKARVLGLGQDRSALRVLREVSARTPREIKIDVREIIYNGDQLRLDGTTPSFEAINRLSQSLEASSLFEQTQIADAKMSADGSQVDFRLNLKISAEGLSP